MMIQWEGAGEERHHVPSEKRITKNHESIINIWLSSENSNDGGQHRW